MLAIVLLLLIVVWTIGIFLGMSVFLSIVLGGFEEQIELPTGEQTRLFLDKASHLRADPEDDQSPTFGQLMEQGHFDDLLEESQLVCEALSRDA